MCIRDSFAVVDVFDALTSERPYKVAMPLAEALQIIRQDSGRNFDPAVVDVFHMIGPDLYAQTCLLYTSRCV